MKTLVFINHVIYRVISKLPKNDDLIYKKINDTVVFGIPFNIHFIGLMNDVDRSIDAFDLALRRRFKWIAKECEYDVIAEELEKYGFNKDSIQDYVDSCQNLNNFICNVGANTLGLGNTYEIGHSFFLKIKNTSGKKVITKNKKIDIFENYIVGTLKEYIRQVADENMVNSWVKAAKEAFGI